MTESDKINGWTFEETVKTATNLMEVENNMFKWDVLRHLRDFAEMYEEEVQQYRALGNIEELRHAKEKQIQKKPILKHDVSVMHINRGNQPHEWKMLESDNWHCSECDSFVGERVYVLDMHHDQRKKKYCDNCGQKLDWSDSD